MTRWLDDKVGRRQLRDVGEALPRRPVRDVGPDGVVPRPLVDVASRDEPGREVAEPARARGRWGPELACGVTPWARTPREDAGGEPARGGRVLTGEELGEPARTNLVDVGGTAQGGRVLDSDGPWPRRRDGTMLDRMRAGAASATVSRFRVIRDVGGSTCRSRVTEPTDLGKRWREEPARRDKDWGGPRTLPGPRPKPRREDTTEVRELFGALPKWVQDAARGELAPGTLCTMLHALYGERVPGAADLVPVARSGLAALVSSCSHRKGSFRAGPDLAPTEVESRPRPSLPKDGDEAALAAWLNEVRDRRKRVWTRRD